MRKRPLTQKIAEKGKKEQNVQKKANFRFFRFML
jgi:hypothetical protein